MNLLKPPRMKPQRDKDEVMREEGRDEERMERNQKYVGGRRETAGGTNTSDDKVGGGA